MEGHAAIPTRTGQLPAGWCDLHFLAAIVLFAALVHSWLVWHTSVPARDGVGLIRYAWQLQHQPWRPVLLNNAHPPLYPLAVGAMSAPVRRLRHTSEPVVMQMSAQAASALAGVLLVIPMFFLGRELFNRKVGIGAALLFQCLPDPARITSDALTEGLFLLLAVTALVFGVRSIRSRSPLLFALCGFFSGLAYLTRPEGLLVGISAGVLLVLMQRSASLRRPWRQVAGCAAALTIATACVVLPYAVAIGGVTLKPTARQVMGAQDAEPDFETHIDAKPPADALPLEASILAIRWDLSGKEQRLVRTAKAVAYEVGKAFHLAWLPALWGMWCFRERLRRQPEMWLVGLLCAGLALLVGRVAWARGYVSERHTLVFVLCGTFWAVAALGRLADRLAQAWRQPAILSAARVKVLLLAVLAVAGVPELLKPMHANRAGHRHAGTWLAEHADPRAVLLDPFCWADYYSGRCFREELPSSSTNLSTDLYVIAEQSKLEHRWLRGRDEAARLISRGIPVFRCPLQSGGAAEVVVYRVTAGTGAAAAN